MLREPRKLVKDAKQAIVIQLKTCNGLGLDQIEWDTIRFFINGPRRHAFRVHELLLNNACCLEYVASNGHGKTEAVTMPVDHIQPAGFEPDEAMLTSLRKEFPGYLLLFEYFCFPEKFLFIDFKGLEKFSPKDMDTLELWIYLDREVMQDLPINVDTFSIHCTPVINLFRYVSGSLNVEQSKSEYRLTPDDNPDTTEIYSIEKVMGTATGSPEIELKPLYSHRHHLGEDDAPGKAFWHTQRRPSGRKNDNGTDVVLSFSGLDLKPAHPAVEQLVVHADCTNRDLPTRLLFGDPDGDLMIEGSFPVRKTNFAPEADAHPQTGAGRCIAVAGPFVIKAQLPSSDTRAGRCFQGHTQTLRFR
jgi:type VI secretion system protein ImpG